MAVNRAIIILFATHVPASVGREVIMMKNLGRLIVVVVFLFVLDVVATEYSTNNPALEPFFVAPIIKLLAGILPFYH